MPDIKLYTNYRKYLRDFYEEEKAARRGFSYRYIAKEVGFNTAGFFGRILNGEKNISREMIAKFRKFLQLKGKDGDYFTTLVNFNQAKTHEDRTKHLKKLVRFKNSWMKDTGAGQYKFYEKWYYTAVRETLNFFSFSGKFENLAKMIQPPIKPSQAKEAVEFLEQNGMITRGPDNVYRLKDKFINAGRDLAPVSIHSFQMATMDLAKQALDRVPAEERDISTLTLSLSEEGINKIKDKIMEVRSEMLEIAKNDRQVNQVYQVNFQAFPMSKNRGRKP